MANAGKKAVKARFLPPGSLCRGRVQSLKTSCRPISMETQIQGEQAPIKGTQVQQPSIEVVESGPNAEATTKEDLVFEEHGAHDHQQQPLPLWYKRDIMHIENEIAEEHSNSSRNKGLGDGEQLQTIVNSTNPSQNHSPGNDGCVEMEKSTVANSLAASGDSKKRKRSANSRPRGRNKVRQVATLKDGEKLDVTFYNNGPVGKNGAALTRHIGKLVRDRYMLPVKVHSWSEIDPKDLDKLWAAIVDKFKGGGIEHRRKELMTRARRLWTGWRGEMMQRNLKGVSSVQKALKPRNIPKSLTKEDWEWLVVEHYMDPDFQIKSAINSENRAQLTMLPRTGSRPIRDVIYEDLGGKDGKVPDIAEIFKATRKKKDGTLEKEDAIIYNDILGESEKNPSMPQFELVEKCFGPQDRDRVICFGLGMKPKDVRGPEPSKADLKAQLQQKNQHITELESRLNNIEHLEADHQKKILDMQASHKKDIGELQGEIKVLKDIVFQKLSNILPPPSTH